MKTRQMQTGATLVVSMIMLVVLTLLAVTAIRSGTTNLRIVGNMQVKAETTAAAQQAIEEVIDGDFTSVPAAQSIDVDMGVATYTVQVTKPTCSNSVPVTLDELKKEDPDDALCFGDNDQMPVIDSEGKQLTTAAKCNKQVWEVQAEVTDANSGAKTSVVQGISKRTYLPTAC